MSRKVVFYQHLCCKYGKFSFRKSYFSHCGGKLYHLEAELPSASGQQWKNKLLHWQKNKPDHHYSI